MSGDIWLVDGIRDPLGVLRWKRFATGLNQPLGLKVVDGVIERPAYDAVLRELAPRPQIYGKLREILRRVDGEVSTNLGDYRDHLDHLADTFGDDRIIFGSDWPNSDGFAASDHVFRLATEYAATRPPAVAE